MKKYTIVLIVLYTFLCGSMLFAAGEGVWTQKAGFGGGVRSGAVGFSIGVKGYIGTGRHSSGAVRSDFWEYNPTTNTWTQKADFGGGVRRYAVGFSIGTKGYIGAGWNDYSYYSDFWEYDPAANAWTQKADFGGGGRDSAVGFSIGAKGYIGTGGYNADFWEYDPATNIWTQKTDFGGGGRAGAVGFSIGAKGYIGTGGYNADFWEYNPTADTWTQKADFGGGGRDSAVGFSIGAKGYIGTGWNGDDYSDFWEYDPANNTWTRKADFGGEGRDSAVGFSIGTRGYIGTGGNGSVYSDFLEYTPSGISTDELPHSGYTQGSSLAVPYSSVALSFIPGNIFTAYLSDASGSFANEIALGALTGTDTSGIIQAIISADTAYGTGYRVRVKSSDPEWTGSDNGRDITIHNIIINGRNEYTTIHGVTLTLGCPYVSGCSSMQFSNNGSTWSDLETFATTRTQWDITRNISTTNGTKTVFVRFTDTTDTLSTAYSNTIILDTVPPTASLSGNSPTTISSTITVSGTDAATYQYMLDSGSYSEERPISTPITLTDLTEGTHTLKVITRDVAGNESSAVTHTWIVDTDYNKGIWTQLTDFGGGVRSGAVGFSIGARGYIGTGSSNGLCSDFWEYDPATNVWTQKADFGGGVRSDAVGFSIGAKGYIGTGFGGADFWEYDPATNIWTRKADFGGGVRDGAVGFSIGTKGYIGTGGYNADFWEYDPATNIWTRKADFGGGGRRYAVGFSIGTTGYIGTGRNSTGDVCSDFWEYDPATNTWTRKADFGGGGRRYAVGFSISAKGYIGTGSNIYDVYSDFWEYDPTTNTWTRKADFSGGGQRYAVGFSIGAKGYIGTGQGKSDFWEYSPSGISTDALSHSAYAQGSSLAVPFSSVTLSFNTGNVFTAYLSDASGNFTNEVAIGTLAGTDASGTIQATIPADIASGTGYRIRVKSSSPVWTESDNGSKLSIADTILPAGSLSINSGATYTTNASVTLTISCDDNTGSCSHMQFTNDNTNWSFPEESYAATKSWTLSAGDGDKTVYVKFKDQAGNWSSVSTASIILDTTHPQVTLGNLPASTTAATSLSVTVSGTDVTAYKWKLDTDTYSVETPVATAITVTGITEGEHTLSVIGRDAAGNWQSESSPTTHTWTVDITAPAAIVSGTPANNLTNSTDLTVTITGTGATAYRYKLDGGAYSEAAIATPLTLNSLTEGAHTLWVITQDLAGNWQVVPTTYVFTVDRTPPVATLGNLPASPTAATSLSVTVSGTDVTAYKWKLDTDTYSVETPVATAITVTGITEGEHTLSVIGRDAAGNWQSESSPTTHTWTVDITAPAAVVSGTPANNLTNSTDLTVTITGTGATVYRYKLDGGAYSEAAIATPLTLNSLTEGAHTLWVITQDLAGNWQVVPTTYVFTVDRTPPVATLGNLPASPTAATSLSVTVSGTDVTAYKWKLDTDTYSVETPVATAITVTGITEGEHTLSVIGRDAAGNWQSESSPTTHTWTVDITAPAAIVSGTPANNLTNSTDLTVTITGTGATAYRYKLDGGAYSEAAIATPLTLNSLTEGAHTLWVITQDLAGNWQVVPTTYVFTVDRTPPVATLGNLPASPTAATSLSVTVSGTDVTAYKWKLDTDTYSVETPVATAITVTGITEGEHTLSVIGRDAAGNWQSESSPTTHTWNVISSTILKGDVDGNLRVDLADVILAMQIISSYPIPGTAAINIAADVNGDNKIGMAEVIYVLQTVAEVR